MSLEAATEPTNDPLEAVRPPEAHTLAFDVGGSGLKATVLDPSGTPEHERVRVKTTYPLSPDKLVAELVGLAGLLPPAHRVSVGFPGVVRGGHVVTAPAFSTVDGPGTLADPALQRAWSGFDLAGGLAAALGLPVRVGNDADVQGAGVTTGQGLELILTLGTGLGSSVFRDGRLALHLELAHLPVGTRSTYNDHVGDAARKAIGPRRWIRRVRKALATFDRLIVPDAILLGGGNATKVDLDELRTTDPELAERVRIVGNDGGLLGGIRLWQPEGLV